MAELISINSSLERRAGSGAGARTRGPGAGERRWKVLRGGGSERGAGAGARARAGGEERGGACGGGEREGKSGGDCMVLEGQVGGGGSETVEGAGRVGYELAGGGRLSKSAQVREGGGGEGEALVEG
ncbi:unnamed protein product [Closterium sp. NIES-65]|nr:unnamed protein product [Closterium sp. NIES-65]